MANVTKLVIVIAPVPEPDLLLVDRQISRAVDQGMEIMMVVNKCDLDSAALAEKFRRHCPEVISFDSAEKGFDEAFALAKEQNAAVLICGSLYLAGEIRPYILNKI